MTRGTDVSPSGIKWRSDFDSSNSQGDIQAYHAVGLAAHAMHANGVSLYMTSVSKMSIVSSGAATCSVLPSLQYLVHPLRRTHLVGLGGGFAHTSCYAMLRYGSPVSTPSL